MPKVAWGVNFGWWPGGSDSRQDQAARNKQCASVCICTRSRIENFCCVWDVLFLVFLTNNNHQFVLCESVSNFEQTKLHKCTNATVTQKGKHKLASVRKTNIVADARHCMHETRVCVCVCVCVGVCVPVKQSNAC